MLLCWRNKNRFWAVTTDVPGIRLYLNTATFARFRSCFYVLILLLRVCTGSLYTTPPFVSDVSQMLWPKCLVNVCSNIVRTLRSQSLKAFPRTMFPRCWTKHFPEVLPNIFFVFQPISNIEQLHGFTIE